MFLAWCIPNRGISLFFSVRRSKPARCC